MTMRYWGFHSVHAILSSATSIDGDLYIPARNTRTEKLVVLAAGHAVRVRYCKDPSVQQRGGGHATGATNGMRYPLLVTNSAISPRTVFRTVEHYLSFTQRTRELLVLLDGVTDIGNIASIVRSGYHFGITCLATSHKTSGDLPLLMHRSAGHHLQLDTVESVNIAHAIETLKKNNFWIYGADAAGAPLSTIAFDTSKCALVMGDEHKGLRAQTKRLCDFTVAIPQRTPCESLNVGVATGIILYEIDRQHRAHVPT